MRLVLDLLQLVGLLMVVAACAALAGSAWVLASQLAILGVGSLAAVEAMEWMDRKRRGGARWV